MSVASKKTDKIKAPGPRGIRLAEPSKDGERRGDRRVSDKLKPIFNQILAADKIDELLVGTLTEDMQFLFNSNSVTIYAVDRSKNQLYSCNYLSEKGEEIRFDISEASFAGYAAASGKFLNITNALDKEELKKYHPKLAPDKFWLKRLKNKTLPVLLAPLMHNERLMGVLEVLDKTNQDTFSEEDERIIKEISLTLAYALSKKEVEDTDEKIRLISHAIHSANTIDDIFLTLPDPMRQLFNARKIIIYAVDDSKKKLYSVEKSGNTVKDLNAAISAKNIPGCVAMQKKIINIDNVHNDKELRAYQTNLVYDKAEDKILGFKAQSMLVYPLINNKKLMGVLQLINSDADKVFSFQEEKHVKNLGQSLALALFNKRKQVQLKPTKFSYLISNGIITQDELNKATAGARNRGKDIEEILLGKYKIKPADLGKSLSKYYSIPYQGYSDSVILPQSLFAGLNLNFLIKNSWLPIQKDSEKVVILIDDPLDLDKIRNIEFTFPKRKIEYKVSLKSDISQYLRATPEEDDEPTDERPMEAISSLLDALESETSIEDALLQSAQQETEESAISESDSTIVRLANKILIEAYDQGISDIHIEPGIGKKLMKVRFRKDGICRIYQEIPSQYKQALISRIKIMAKLDIAERRLPQDGKIKMKYGKKDIEYRVATCPTVGGCEDAVLRILASSKPIPLEGMNFSERNYKLTKGMAASPYGLILVVGPTGSGKTTTLHSVLGHINTPEIKIWTAEDPVEITQEGLRQVQMHDKIGLNFARAMRSFLRGDPDVIMVGEMRDTETASIGLEASLTGHLVFSTLHTNTAPETITRLLDMGMNPLNFADALLLIIAQRLARTLCKKCKEPYHPSQEEFDTLAREYGKNEFPKLGVEYNKDLKLYKPAGCADCDDKGYSGRIGLHELLEGTDTMKRMIMQKTLVEDLRKQAIADGMTTLKQDGISKVFQGHCDLKQIMSVCIV